MRLWRTVEPGWWWLDMVTYDGTSTRGAHADLWRHRWLPGFYFWRVTRWEGPTPTIVCEGWTLLLGRARRQAEMATTAAAGAGLTPMRRSA